MTKGQAIVGQVLPLHAAPVIDARDVEGARDGGPVRVLAHHAIFLFVHLRRADAYRRRGELEAATRDLRQASQLDPSAVRPLDDLGDVLLARGRFRRAADVYEARLRIDDRSSDALYKLGLARYNAGDARAALVALTRGRAAGAETAQADYLEALTEVSPGEDPVVLPPLVTVIARRPTS